MGRIERQFRRVLDALFAFAGVLDVDGTVIEVNQAALCAANLSSSDVIGRKFWNCHWWNFSPESQARLRASIAQAAGGERVRYDVMVRMEGEARRWIDFQLAPLQDDDDVVTRIIASATDITDRKLTERRMRASEERLRRASRAARVGIWEWNITTGAGYWSEETYELLDEEPGVPPAYKRWIEKVHPEDRPRVIRTKKQALHAARRHSEEAVLRHEYRVRHRDGSTLWLESVGACAEENGEVLTMGVLRDITERKRAEQALRESEEKLRFVAERAEVGYWLWDIAADRLEWSSWCRRLFGVADDEAVSYDRFLAAVHPTDRDRIDAAVHACLESGGLADIDAEFRTQWPDGTVRWLHCKGSATFDAASPVRMAGIVHDITTRKRDEKLLAEQSALMETLMGKAPVGFAFVDKACRYVRVNAMLAKMNGMSAPSHIGRTVNDVVPDVWPTVEPFYQRALAGEAMANLEVEARTRATRGETRHWLASYYPVRVGTRIVGVGTVIVDITAQKRNEALLKEADRRKDEFLALLAHELRNPLAPIRNAVRILSMKGPREAPFRSVTGIMERQVSQMVRLIDDLLDVSRINHGKLQLRRRPLALEHVVQQALDASLPLMEAAEQELTVSTPHESVWTDGDPARLAQVFSNLLNNASKYTPKGGCISVTVGQEDDCAVLSVRDTGIGIAPERLEEIFQLFAQIETGCDEVQEGLGLGLPLAKSLVEMHGGTLTAASAGPGAGSEFIVRLPLLTADAIPAEPPAIPAQQPAHRRRILVADDNRDSAESLAMVLRLLGHDVELAYDGAEALTRAQACTPEVILLDIRMPRMSGLEACRAIRAHACGRGALLVALSGYGQAGDREESRAAGFNAHLVKPVDVDKLTALLDTAFQGAPRQVSLA